MMNSFFLQPIVEFIKKLLILEARLIFLFATFVGLFLVLSAAGTYIFFAKDLNTREGIMNRNNSGIILSDRNGVEYFTFYQAKYQEYVPLASIPEHTQNAVIASEDKEFNRHNGFSPKGIARSVYLNFKTKDLNYGGSTITQQLVKNSLLTPKKNIVRKFQELVLAFEIERLYEKDEIMEMYLNSAYFGEGAFGIESAAQIYFGKKARDLSLAESTLLVGILPSPSHLSPLNGDGDGARVRQEYVLDQMVDQGFIGASQKEQAFAQNLQFSKKEPLVNTRATHFALMVRDELIKTFGEQAVVRSGFKVKTSIDLSMQEYAEDSVEKNVANLAANNAHNGAAVALKADTGEILAFVGSKNWDDEKYGKVNMAYSPRQPGSSFKPIVYSIALDNKIITPATILRDRPTTFQTNYKPENYDKRFRGNVTVRRALANSLNVPSVEVMDKVGIEEVLTRSKDFGIYSLSDKTSDYGLSLVLGTGEITLLEMAGAYSTFANNGVHVKPTAILEIVDKKSEVIYTFENQPKQVLSPQAAYLITSILSDTQARREVFGRTLDVGRTAAVKTGTSENYRDAWTIGYTPKIVVGVWVGNNYNEPMDTVAGSLGAAPIWRDLITEFHDGQPDYAFAQPEGIITASACSFTGSSATPSARLVKEVFIEGTAPRQRSCPRNIAPRIERDENNTPQMQVPDVNAEEELRREIERVQEEVRRTIEGQKNENNSPGNGNGKENGKNKEEKAIVWPSFFHA